MNPSINLAKVCVFVCVISPQIHIGSLPNFQHMPNLTKEKIATLIEFPKLFLSRPCYPTLPYPKLPSINQYIGEGVHLSPPPVGGGVPSLIKTVEEGSILPTTFWGEGDLHE